MWDARKIDPKRGSEYPYVDRVSSDLSGCICRVLIALQGVSTFCLFYRCPLPSSIQSIIGYWLHVDTYCRIIIVPKVHVSCMARLVSPSPEFRMELASSEVHCLDQSIVFGVRASKKAMEVTMSRYCCPLTHLAPTQAQRLGIELATHSPLIPWQSRKMDQTSCSSGLCQKLVISSTRDPPPVFQESLFGSSY